MKMLNRLEIGHAKKIMMVFMEALYNQKYLLLMMNYKYLV
jgi:hypothetical protein